MENYSRNKIFFILVTFLILVYYSVDYIKFKEAKTEKKCLILDKRCSVVPSIRTYIKIEFNKKKYIIDVNKKNCDNYTIGKKALFLYDLKNDYFIDRNYKGNKPYKLIILGLVFIILLIPNKIFQQKK